MTWILNADCVEHHRSFDDNMDQTLEIRRQHGPKFEFFDGNMDRNVKFSTTTWIEILSHDFVEVFVPSCRRKFEP